MPEMDSNYSRTILPAFFLSRLGLADNIEHTGCTFWGGHWHKWVVATMGNFLPNNQPQAAALGMVSNNSEVLTQMSTTSCSIGHGEQQL